MRCIKKIDNKKGFSLLEMVITIIVIGLALSAIVESFIVGSAKSVNIVYEETATNVAKQIMAELNYCRNGGAVNGVCTTFNGGTWTTPTIFYTTPQGPTPINNEYFCTVITASCVVFNDTFGSGKIAAGSCPPKTDYIQTIVQTWWTHSSPGGSCPVNVPSGYPSVRVSTIFANY